MWIISIKFESPAKYGRVHEDGCYRLLHCKGLPVFLEKIARLIERRHMTEVETRM